MTDDLPRPPQFSLKGLFGLTGLVGLSLALVPAAMRAPLPAGVPYALIGVAQLACLGFVYQRLRSDGARPPPKEFEEPPYELALLGAFFTLATWAFVAAWMIGVWMGNQQWWLWALLLAVALLGILLQLPILGLQVLGLFAMPRRSHHGWLLLLILLNIANTLTVFLMLALGLRQGLFTRLVL